MSDVLRLAAQGNPNWNTFVANHAAAHAELIEACAYPNPEVEIDIGRARASEPEEDGSRPRSGTSELAFSQPIELPGKRLARQVEAQTGFAVVAGETLEFNAQLRAEVIEAYYTVQYHAATERLWQTLLQVTEGLLSLAETRIAGGIAGPIESVNARVEVLKARSERDAARRRKLGARAALDALTGGLLGTKFRLSDPLPSRPAAMSLREAIASALSAHPKLQRLSAELEQRYASIDTARTSWWPDLRLGLRKSTELDSQGVGVTAGFEIPLWNRNQGGIAAARAEAEITHAAIAIAFNELRRDVETAFQEYEMARDQLGIYSEGLREAAEQAVAISYVQYREGAAGYIDVLTSRRTLQKTIQTFLEVRFNAATARAKLERAVGRTIGSTVAATPTTVKRPSRAGSPKRSAPATSKVQKVLTTSKQKER